MSSKRAENVATPHDALVAGLEEGRTGRFIADGTPRLEAFVMLGDVLACNSDADDEQLLRRLRAAGLLDAPTLDALPARVGAEGTLGELLFDLLPEAELHDLLFERFRENLFRFLLAARIREFEPLEAVFTENIQTGHDSRALVEELRALGRRTAGLSKAPAMVLAAGAAPPRTAEEHALLERVPVRIGLADLVAAAPAEPNRTLALVQGMLDEGMLVGVVSRSGRTLPPVPPAAAPPPAEAERTAPIASVPDPASVEDTLGPLPPAAPSPPLEEGDPDEETVETPVTPINRPNAASRFVDPADEGTDEDLAAFQDYDTSREGGSFSTERDLLDRVDLGLDATPPPPAPSTETLIEMEDAEGAGKDAMKSAVSLNFSGPKLSEDEVQRKLMVTNDVLATIAMAIDQAEGRGAGVARLQLLVESTGVSLAPLFSSVELGKDGRLPTGQIAKNLRRRPVSEHRRLLNRALSDLIERALSVSDEILDEEGLESMLEQIAGYQQRLGV